MEMIGEMIERMMVYALSRFAFIGKP